MVRSFHLDPGKSDPKSIANYNDSSLFYEYEIIIGFISELCDECCFCRSFLNSE